MSQDTDETAENENKKATVRLEITVNEDNDKFENIVEDASTVFSPIASILDMLGFTVTHMEVWNEHGEYFEITPEIIECGAENDEDGEDEEEV